jgi:recombination protein RecR
MAGSEIERLIELLAKLPGLGPRSARRAALYLIKRKENVLEPLSTALKDAAANMQTCELCGNLDTVNPCAICTDARRDTTIICTVEEVGDLWAMERSGAFKGLYHVLGGTLSALDGIGPDDLNIAMLEARVENGEVKEVILALNATVDGQTTAHYVAERLATDTSVTVTKLAHGLPMGGEIDYLDQGTLSAALKARRPA